MRLQTTRALSSTALILVLSVGGAAAQDVVSGTEQLEFNRPEAWAMKYFATVGIMTGFGVPPEIESGAIDLGFEGGWIPSLSEDQRRVGFDGTKLEDLNRTSFFGRIRLTIGLPNQFSLGLGYVPPISVGGIKPNLFAVSIGRPFKLTDQWRLGLRGYGQFGTIEGDITCDAETVAAGRDPERNPFFCQEISNDQHKQRMAGGEATLGWVSPNRRWTPYFGFAVNYMDLEFQVDAQYSGLIDQTLQLTDGASYSVTSGVGYTLTPKLKLTGEVFYSWLDVVRPPATSTQNDGLFNLRFLISYQLR
jgi:hypothetical protein